MNPMPTDPMSPEEMSPALQFVMKCWEHATHKSWTKLNTAMYRTVVTAIMSDMRFDAEDFAKMPRRQYWITQGGEGLYSLACGSDHGSANNSAAIAMETSYFQRKAFLWSDDGTTPNRLYVGAYMKWDGRTVFVTSMSADSLVACSYKDRSNGKIDKRYTITREAMLAERKGRKMAADAKKNLTTPRQ